MTGRIKISAGVFSCRAPEEMTMTKSRVLLAFAALMITASVPPASADSIPGLRGHDHTGITVPDVKAATAFFIRNQGFVRPTAARQISFEDSLAFERLHEQTYRDLGFQLVEVPAGPLADRVALIRQTVSQQQRPD